MKMLDIKLSYDEGGGRVNRAYHLPENPKLVTSILGAIKRHGPKEEPEEEPGEEPEKDTQTAEPALPVEAEQETEEPDQTAVEPKPEPKQAKKPKRYNGFMLIHCPACGADRAVSIGKPTSSFACQCGHEIPLEGVVKAKFHCKQCGSEWTYWTNCEEADASVDCVHCGREMTSRWDAKERAYRPTE